MNAPDTSLTTASYDSAADGYNFAYLDEQTKRMLRRALLKAVAVPGYQVPFGSREMPLPFGWGTGRHSGDRGDHRQQRHAEGDRSGSDETTNAVNIRRFFARTTGVRPRAAPSTRRSSRRVTAFPKRRSPTSRFSSIRCRCPSPFRSSRVSPNAKSCMRSPITADQREALRGHRASRQHRPRYDYPVIVNHAI
jgi:Uncharacterized enzyme of phosphonate metabolism